MNQTVCSYVQPGATEETLELRRMYDAHMAQMQEVIFANKLYLDDFLRRWDKLGEPDLTSRTYYARGARLLRCFADLQEQEVSILAKQDGDVWAFYRTAVVAFTAMKHFSELYNDIDGKAAVVEGLAEGRTRASQNRMVRKAQEEVQILEALHELWAAGARYATRDAWTNKVIEMLPHLSPPKGKPNDTLNDRVSKIGRDEFGADWPVKPRGRRQSSQLETN